jgi:hypothetical protein
MRTLLAPIQCRASAAALYASLNLLAAGLLAASAAGCASTRASATAYRRLPPKASAADVQVFADGRPAREYEELGLIEVSKFGLGDGYGRLIERARAEAAKMGADAILVTRERRVAVTNTAGAINAPDKRGTRTVTSSSSTLEEPRLSVTAIVWKGR